jgi:hypothetical protein
LGSVASQGTFGRQLSVTEQTSSGWQASSFGKYMHWPAKQVLVVHEMPSSQSASSQH